MSVEVLFEKVLSNSLGFTKVIHVLRDIQTTELYSRIGCYTSDTFEVLSTSDRINLNAEEFNKVTSHLETKDNFKIFLPRYRIIEGFNFEYIHLYQLTLRVGEKPIARVVLNESELKILCDYKSDIQKIFRNESSN